MSGPELITLGCRLNLAESDMMRALAAGQDDLVIVNSCAVTARAVSDSRKAIRRAHAARPDARIFVTGCAAQIAPAAFAAMPGVARVIGNRHKLDPASFAPPMALRALPAAARRLRTRAFVEVQNGCDHRCTFCIIPQGRGVSRSVPGDLVIERIAAFVDAGCNEVVLTGVDLTSYGPDLPGAPTLGSLVEHILREVPALRRLRLSSLDPVEIDDRLFDVVTGDDRVMPHLHLSLQAGDDMVLKRMKRRHDRAQAVGVVTRLKAARPELAIGADLISGFPTEDEEMASNTLTLLDDCDIVFGHVFPYSPRAGTPAARMPQVPQGVIKARAAALRAAAERRRLAWLETLSGTIQQVLVEGAGGHGHAANYAEARFAPGAVAGPPAGNWPVAGEVAALRVTHVEGGTLVGVRA